MADKIKNLGVYRFYDVEKGKYYGSYEFKIIVNGMYTGFAFNNDYQELASIRSTYEKAKDNELDWGIPGSYPDPDDREEYLVPIELILNLE